MEISTLKIITTHFSFFFSVSTGEGIHWFAICRTSPNSLEVFDSLGTTADYIKKHIPLKKGKFQYNTFAVQCNDSYYCGGFVIYYLIERYSNLDLDFDELINDIFSPDCDENQLKVKEFLSSLNYTLK